MRKGNLLSIGDLSKLTGASIKSLRYYERISILKPAYVDRDTKYRYYALNQTNIVGIIMSCVDFGIPLRELAKFIDNDDTVDFRGLLAYGKEIAMQKQKALEQGVQLINALEKEIDRAVTYRLGEIYCREVGEKYFHVKPCGSNLNEADHIQIAMETVELALTEEEFNSINEYGIMGRFLDGGCEYYVFIELPNYVKGANLIKIPAGTYHCLQSEDEKIEEAGKIFAEYLGDREDFIAIETEVYTNRYSISRPVNELRVMVLD